ncbi:RidA family protein [Hoeflea sp. WL0058]|uniref:RidA family protein n=1 Tax=Flavimaribacter sediminis TaxID=2865987 RepID=A0AAE2ZU88_9HYPH|nr:RidA family protein [Flavimaribacter sediminis]MBW8639722.1 RidA family protein [Flavimaribacter sediminis]
MRALTPKQIAPPFAHYSHGVEAPPGSRIVRTSGQLGLRDDGVVPDDVRSQAEICFANIDAILAEAGMDRSCIFHITAYVTDRAWMQGYMQARDAYVAGVEPPPASTLIIVSGFTREEFKVEIEVMAAAE